MSKKPGGLAECTLLMGQVYCVKRNKKIKKE